MPKASQSNAKADKADSLASAFFSDNPMFQPAGGMEAMTRASQAFFNAAVEVNTELAAFISMRLREDMLSAQALVGARNVDQAFLTQADFVETTIRKYADEGSKLLHIWADAAKKMLIPFEEEALEDLFQHERQRRAGDAARSEGVASASAA